MVATGRDSVLTDGVAPRAAAARAIAAVFDGGRSLDDALGQYQVTVAERDRALVHALAYGVLRDYRYLATLLQPLLRRKPQPLLQALLLVGVYQLRAMRIPAHAAVHATVSAAPKLGFGKARGMVNAILRRCQREMPRLEAAVPEQPAIRHSHPDWLVERLQSDWADRVDALLRANNTPAPMHLRVNRHASSREAYLQELSQAGIDESVPDDMADAITLAQPVATSALPGFAEGRVSVQDLSAQRAADLLTLADGQRVLDACAAPGNKTAHALERAAVELLALDVDSERLATLQDNLKRLHLRAETRVGDATRPTDWWDGRPFDRILLDAPCSGTGVIRRHPDIKWLRRAADIDTAVRRQHRLLATLWPLLAEGGLLVYATCSILRAEGAGVVQPFVEAMTDAEAIAMPDRWGEAEAVGRRIAPGEHGGDGFYYACIRR